MVAHWLLGVGLLTVLGAEPSGGASKSELARYEELRATVGRDAAAQVNLALWCEAHGLPAERLKHLAVAVLTDPTNATARGLMGLVEYGGRWQRPDAVTQKVKADEALSARLAEYNTRRETTRETAADQAKLALWCEQNGLLAEMVAHLTTVTRLDPANESAWKKLGYKKHGNRWVTDAQLAAEKAEADAQKKADRHWRPLLTKWKGWLGDVRHRDEVEDALADVSDPRAVPSVWAVFAASKDAEAQARAVELFGRIDAPDASRALAVLAVYARPAEVRRAAAETLARRDRREYLDALIAALRDPIQYEAKPVGGPGSPGSLTINGKRFNVKRVYSPPAVNTGPIPANARLVFDQNGLPVLTGVAGFVQSSEMGPQLRAELGIAPVNLSVSPQFQSMAASLAGGALGPQGQQLGQFLSQEKAGASAAARQASAEVTPNARYDVIREADYQIPIGRMMIEAQQAAAVAGQQLRNDVNAIDSYNNQAHDSNDVILAILKGATGQDLGEDQESWAKWWTNEQGYALSANSTPTTTFVENVPIGFVPQAGPQLATGPIVGFQRGHSCFAAGTAVRTLTGLRPIEAVRAGDRVLAQDSVTGLLTYQPVVAVFHNRPNETLRVALGGGETVVATGIHRFWKVGQGWVMARDLKPGDALRTLGGARAVESVETERVQPVYNLQVAGGQSFLVGAAGLLVHDNSVVNPVSHPFDAEPALAANGR